MSIKFYEVQEDYTDFLRSAESRIPTINYINNNKFLCGVVFSIEKFNYYAPISSFNQKQFTNMPIYHNGKIISTVRFSYMFPCPENVLTEKDFLLEPDIKYRDLLLNELAYCNSHYDDIKKKAAYIYKRYLTGKDTVLLNHCCNFPVLEEKMQEYIIEMKLDEADKVAEQSELL